ncbi:hypothetical protein ONZ45_g7727 [Pleurotus djamor]|nr:hypothetical protein ONZ45_g7727 [Pleurotus djamor]
MDPPQYLENAFKFNLKPGEIFEGHPFLRVTPIPSFYSPFIPNPGGIVPGPAMYWDLQVPGYGYREGENYQHAVPYTPMPPRWDTYDRAPRRDYEGYPSPPPTLDHHGSSYRNSTYSESTDTIEGYPTPPPTIYSRRQSSVWGFAEDAEYAAAEVDQEWWARENEDLLEPHDGDSFPFQGAHTYRYSDSSSISSEAIPEEPSSDPNDAPPPPVPPKSKKYRKRKPRRPAFINHHLIPPGASSSQSVDEHKRSPPPPPLPLVKETPTLIPPLQLGVDELRKTLSWDGR